MPSVGFELVDPSDSPCLRPGVRLDLRWHKPSQADHKKPMCQAEQDQLQKDNAVGQILFVGAPQAGKYSLVSCLLNPAKTLSKQSESRQIWHLDTKYYTTAVSIGRLHPAEQATEQAVLSQGLVLVFDATSEASFVAVSKWAASLPNSVGDIRLCIANRVDGLPRQPISKAEAAPDLQRSSWLQAAQQWCTDNQFEYIEASSTDRKLDESLVWDEQQQGVCRIKQALEANYWPGLEMKQQHSQPTAPNADGCQGSYQIAVTNGTCQSVETASGSSGNTESNPNGFEDFQSADEADLDQFDTMFGELRATRDRLQDLPRDQRQLAAADVALRIAAILGLDEESDDEEPS